MRALGMWTLVVVGLWACIEDAGSPGADDATVDGSFGDGFVDRQDGGPPPRDLGVVDAQVVEGCARWGDPAACAADDCTFRNGQCVDWPSCDGHAVQDGQGLCEDQACQTSLDGACYDAEDPARCDDIDTHNCLFRRCFWWRAPGETARCHVDDRPADCDQPDGASCEAAGCEWTGFGCARPLDTACAALDADACAGRPDCMQTAVGCEVRPDVACAELAQDDCRGRFDCGWLGAACVDLDAEAPCAQQGDWACAERQDCEPLRADGCDAQPKQQDPNDRAAAPDAGAGGGGGAGGAGGGAGGGGPSEPTCAAPEDCGAGAGCADGVCVSCDRFRGCGDRP